MIRKAQLADIDPILGIYQIAREFMKKSGNAQQWGENFPPAGMLGADIEKGQLYVVTEDHAIHGVFAFVVGEEPSYQVIEDGSWKNSEPYGTIHRVASDGTVKGIFEKGLNFSRTLSDNIRIDTHNDNKAMRHLIEKNGFERRGIIHVEDGSPRIAYQYTHTSD